MAQTTARPGSNDAGAAAARRPRLPRRRLAWLALGAVLAAFLGSGVPPIALAFLKPVSRDLVVETRTEPAPVVLDGAEGTGQLSRTLRTGPGEDREQAALEVHTTLTLDGEIAGEARHEQILDRGAALPVPGTLARYTLSLSGEPESIENEVSQPGLRFLFPFQPERRSYPYLDPIARDVFPLDYVDEVELGDLDTYVFSQTLTDLSPQGPWAAVAGEGADYSVERTITLDTDTGQLLDVSEAFDLQAADGSGPVFSMQARWDEDTRAAAYDTAADINLWLRVLQILAWVGGAVAFGFLVALVLVVVRYRRTLRERELS